MFDLIYCFQFTASEDHTWEQTRDQPASTNVPYGTIIPPTHPPAPVPVNMPGPPPLILSPVAPVVPDILPPPSNFTLPPPPLPLTTNNTSSVNNTLASSAAPARERRVKRSRWDS